MGSPELEYLKRFWNSGMPQNISGQPVSVSGQPVTISGDHVYVESGLWIAGMSFSGLDIEVSISGDPVIISGQPVTISGDHVYVEYYCIDNQGNTVPVERMRTDCSGILYTWISGQHVYVESGAFVTTQPGIQVSGTVAISGTITVDISGTPVTISGDHVYVESGATVLTQPGIQVSGTVAISGTLTASVSGQPVTISGDHVYIESGATVLTQPGIQVSGTVAISGTITVDISGTPVTISGDHVYVESGVFVTTNPVDQATQSGLVIHVGCAGTIRTGKLLQLEGGMSGHTLSGVPTASGGVSLCNVSGSFCSGPIHTIIIKNLADNNAVYIGERNCRPYSGFGFLLAEKEAVNFDYCSICDIWAWAQVSGQFITWIGTDY